MPFKDKKCVVCGGSFTPTCLRACVCSASCRKEYRRLAAKSWKEKNRDATREHHRVWREKHKAEVRVRNRCWYEKNKEKSMESGRNWRENNKEKSREIARKHSLKMIATCSDFYVAYNLLGLKPSECPPGLIEAKRSHIKLQRLLKELKK